jgi:proteasome lid subunit RPN8/RPN11
VAIERLVLTPALRDALFAHARDGTPSEVCGVLGGRRERDDADENDTADATSATAIATDHRPVPNVAAEPRFRYELDPAATVDAIEGLETAGLEHVGFYHSHPEGPRGPSRTDEARASWPGYVYLIVSLGEEPVVGAWRWTGESFLQLPIEVASEAER